MNPLHRRRTAESIVVVLLFSTSFLSSARADDPGFQSIFNGKDLTGWRLGGADLAGKTASDDGRFAVKDGVLVIAGSKDTPPRMAEIDTVESYDGDFTLRLEFRASRDANSGLHLRDKAFAHQLQIRDYPRVGPYKTLKGYKRRRLERDRGGRHRHQGPLHLQWRGARSRPRRPRQRATRPAIRDQRGRVPRHPDQAGGGSLRGQTRHPLCRPASRATGAR